MVPASTERIEIMSTRRMGKRIIVKALMIVCVEEVELFGCSCCVLSKRARSGSVEVLKKTESLSARQSTEIFWWVAKSQCYGGRPWLQETKRGCRSPVRLCSANEHYKRAHRSVGHSRVGSTRGQQLRRATWQKLGSEVVSSVRRSI